MAAAGAWCILLAAVPDIARAGGCLSADFTTNLSYDFCNFTGCLQVTIMPVDVHGNDTYSIDWGDGTSYDTLVVADLDNCCGGQLTLNECHYYPGPGSYTITVAVSPSHTTCVIQKEVQFGFFGVSGDVSCTGNGSNGNINYTVGGGTPPFTWQWSNGATVEDPSGLDPGTYTVTITDNNGCVQVDSVTVQDFGFDLNLDNLNCGGNTAGISISRDTVVLPDVDVFYEDFNYPNGTKYGCEPDWRGIWTPTSSSYFFWVNSSKEYQSTGSGTYEWFSECIDLSGCTDVQFSINARPNAGIDNTGDYFRVFYILDGGPETPIVQLGGIGTFPNGTASMSNFTGAIPTGGCVQIVIRISHSSGSESYFFDDITVTCNGGSITKFTEDFTTYQLYDHIGRGGCWRVSGDNHWTSFDVQGGSLRPAGFDEREFLFETMCIDLSGCAGQPTLTIDLASDMGIYSENDEYIDVYYNYNNGADMFLYRKINTDLTEYPTLTRFSGPLPIGPGGCVTIKLKIFLGNSNEAFRIDNVRVQCEPKNEHTYTYLWCTGETTVTATALPNPGSCVVTVTDENGCSRELTVDCNSSCSMSLSTAKVDVPCNGDATGSIDLTVTGGTAPFSYLWSNGVTTQDLSGLTAGSYTVTVTDATPCSETISVTITEPTPLVITPTGGTVLCSGNCNGSVSVSASGGTPGYTYNWSSGGTNASRTGLCAGTYTVTVTDANSCTATTTATITEPTPLVLTPTGGTVLCAGDCDGSISVSASGGTPGYTYNWSSGGTGAAETGLCAGTYTVTVTDANGCTATTTATITEPTPLVLTPTGGTVLCAGDCDGSISVSASGGTPGYTYNWSSGGTGAGATGLCAGTYTVTVTDINGCTATTTATITEPTPLALTPTGGAVLCAGDCDGSVSVSATGGTPGYTYNWSSGGTGTGATGLCAGTYTVTVTDANGCTATTTATITEPTPLALTPTGGVVLCNGDCNGSVSVSASDGTPGYTYNWSAGGSGSTQTGLCAGTYTVTVTDANGCTETTTATITEPTPLVLTPTGGTVLCAGNCDGSVSVSASGGTPGYTYNWSSGGSGSAQSGLCAGTYTVTVTDANGCTNTTTATITEPTPLVLTPTGGTVLCAGDCDGSVSVSASGGTPGYTYNWSSGGSGSTQSGLCAGTYTVTVTDASGCAATTTATITEPAPLVLTPTGGTVLCNGDCNGSVSVSVSGGTTPYSYNWSSGGSGSGQSGLCPGTYTVTVTDFNGCVSTSSAIITEPTPLVLTPTGGAVLCAGDCDGSVSVSASGGTSGYTYNWSAGGSGSTQSGLCAGTYTVTVTDANGCVETTTATITEPTPLVLTPTDGTVLCAGDCDGSVSVSASGGTPTYTYNWSAGGTGATETGLCAGTYTVTVTDANGCVSTSSATITEPTPLVLTPTGGTVLCAGDCDGSVSVSASGGTPTYTYNWSSGGTGVTETGLCAGTYTVTVTDANGCASISSATITDPTPLVLTPTGGTVLCAGDCDGSVSVSASGGTPTYTYNWSSGGTGATETGLCAGTYTVTVTDFNGCVSTSSATITEPTPITLTTSSTPAACGMTDGSVCVSASGGTPNYTYLWSDASSTKTTCLNGLGSGTYTVTVTDNNGCQQVASVSVSSYLGPVATAAGTDVTCPGACDGGGTVSVTDGTPPYLYNWSGGSTNITSVNLCAGTYSVTVTDLNGCQDIATVTVGEPSPVVPAANATDALCAGSCDGSATVSATGGTPGYTYNWSAGGSGSTQSGLCAGTYTVTVTDNNGCTATTTAVVSEPPPITLNITPVDVLCAGDCNGTATVTATGGTPGYTYNWSAGGSGSTQSGLCAGTYTVTVTDANGCVSTGSTTVNEPPPLVVSSTPDQALCPAGTPTSLIGVTATGGTPGYTYIWDDPNTGTTASITVTNTVNTTVTYNVTITDANGCVQTEMVVITSRCAPDVTLNPDTFCLGDCGTLSPVVSGGVPPYSYTWSPAGIGLSGVGPHTVCPTQTTTYGVTVTDGNGLSDSATTVFIVNLPPALTMSNTPALCGQCDGTATVTATGSGPFSYLWGDGSTPPTVTALCAGAFNVTVTDANGCTATEVTSVSNSGGPEIAADSTDVLCFGDCTGTATANVTVPGTPPYTYEWSNSGSDSTITGLCAGNYTVTITDSNSCIAVSNTRVNQPTPVVLNTEVAHNVCSGDTVGTVDLFASGGTPGYTYTWTGGRTTEDIGGLAAGTYTVTVSDSNGCTDTISAVITEPPPLVIGTTGTPATCGNIDGTVSTTVSGGTPGYTYLWSPGGYTTAGVTGLGGGVFRVTVTDKNGCTITDSATVVSDGVPAAVMLNKTDVLCYGECTGTADAGASGGAPGYIYQWSSGGTGTTETGLCAGSYTVTVTDANGCSDTAQVVITEPPLLLLTTAFVNESCSRCNGSVSVTSGGGTPGYTYNWSAGGSGSTQPGLCAGTYTVTVTDSNDCSDTASVSIGDTPGPAALVAGMNVCVGGATLFTYGSTGNIVSCFWTFGDGNTSATCGNVSHTYQNPGTYTVTHVVADANGCTDTVTVVVNVTPLPVVCFTDSMTGCVPLKVSFQNCSSTSDSCVWQMDGRTYYGCSPAHTFFNPGCYDITLTVYDVNGCSATATKPCYIQGYPWPSADFLADPVLTNILNPVVNFTDKSTGAVAWWWNFGDGDTSLIQHPTHTYSDTGCFPVTLIIANQYGCTDTIPTEVCVEDWPSIYIPNAFTPNGDGKNEFFNIKHLGFCECEMYIFDRWGNEIYKMNDCTNGSIGWDGTANGGTKIQQEDVYVWLVLARDCYEGKPWRRIGHVTLVR